MNAERRLRQYEHALREWRKNMIKGQFKYEEPKASDYGLKRVNEVFCAKKVRAKVMEEKIEVK